MRPTPLTPVLVAIWLIAPPLASPALAQPSVDAGANQQVVFPAEAQLDGDVQGLSPTAFWIADGDGPTEDHVVTYDSAAGLGTIGPLEDSFTFLYGWPSDLIRVGPVIYGVDTFWQQIYTLDEATGIVTALGPAAGDSELDTRLGSLAYDPLRNLLYSVDWLASGNDLYSFDLDDLKWKKIKTLSLQDIRGLAWDPVAELLYAYDAATQAIYTMTRTGGSLQFLVAPVHAPGDFYDELSFFGGELYGTLHIDQGGTDVIQVRRIDLGTGNVEDIGPPIVESDGHSLLIESLPEAIEWTVDAGPGIVLFGDATDPDTTAAFSVPGLYVLRLTVQASPPVSDTVDITVVAACGDGIDNDADGHVDYPADLGCDAPNDISEKDETGSYPCDDGVSNESGVVIDVVGGTAALTDDGLIDLNDPGCGGDPFAPAPGTGLAGGEYPQCQDGVDNDGDGRIDLDAGVSVFGTPQSAQADPNCASFADNREKRTGHCGLGSELALLLPALLLGRRRRRPGTRP